MLTGIERMRCCLVTLSVAWAAAMVFASDYGTIAMKADRFFAQKEWMSAAAMFTVMLDEQPRNADTYGKAIVTAGMRRMPAEQSQLMDRALDYHVPFDSVFSAVERVSFSLGQTSMYEDFLNLVKHDKPWLGRSIDAYLLRYYVFRRNADGMIRCSEKMLEGLPDDVNFLSILAQGLLIKGDFKGAMATYERILTVSPDNYEALLYLGNYYKDRAEADGSYAARARECLVKAQAIRDTPYLAAAIARLDGR